MILIEKLQKLRCLSPFTLLELTTGEAVACLSLCALSVLDGFFVKKIRKVQIFVWDLTSVCG